MSTVLMLKVVFNVSSVTQRAHATAALEAIEDEPAEGTVPNNLKLVITTEYDYPDDYLFVRDLTQEVGIVFEVQGGTGEYDVYIGPEFEHPELFVEYLEDDYRVTGVPAFAGAFEFTIVARDENDHVVVRSVQLLVSRDPPNVSGEWLPVGTKVQVLFDVSDDENSEDSSQLWALGNIIEVDPRLEAPYKVKFRKYRGFEDNDCSWHKFDDEDYESTYE